MTVRKVEILICDEGRTGTGFEPDPVRKVISLWSVSGEHLMTLDTWDKESGRSKPYPGLERLVGESD